MKGLLKWSVLTSFLMLFATSQGTSQNSWKRGNACYGLRCTDRRGYFNQKSFLVGRYSPYKSYKLIDSVIPTNFVIYIRNIKNPSQRENFLDLCDINTKCESLTSTEDQIFIYKNVREVLLVVSDIKCQFEVQYYAGCNILDQADVNVQLEPGSIFTQAGSCWVFIPRVYRGNIKQQTAATNIYLANVTLPEYSKLSVCDVLTGQALMNFDKDTDFDLTSSEKSKNEIIYQINQSISSIFLATVESCPTDLCSGISFTMNVQALSESDYQCFRKKQLCELEMMDVEQIKCDAIDAETCSSHQSFIDIIDAATKSATVKNPSGRMRSSAEGSTFECLNKCKLSFIQNKLIPKLCGEHADCMQFGAKCQQYCNLERMYKVFNLRDDGLLCTRR